MHAIDGSSRGFDNAVAMSIQTLCHFRRTPLGPATLGALAAMACLLGLLGGCGGGGGGSAGAGPTTGGGGSGGAAGGGTGGTTGRSQTLAYATVHGADLGSGASLHGNVPFPADNAWNTDVSAAPVDPNSANLIAAIGLTTGVHPDFGAGLYAGAPIGIPYVVVAGTQTPVAIHFTAYGSESDPGPYPIPTTAPIEGQLTGGGAFGGDRHVIVLDRDHDRLYELFNAVPQPDGSWNADAGCIFHLDSDAVRPTAQPGWTSADAAGLPIFPGLARYDEAASGTIAHALRFTVQSSRKAYVPPAMHSASSSTDPNLPPMGMRVRLKASYAIQPTFSAEVQTILRALKRYGMIVADNGSNWYVSGAPDDRWNNDALVGQLAQVKGSDFEVIRMDGLVAR